METFQQPKIKGYRQLSQAEADLMNRIKAKGNEFGELIQELEAMLGKQACAIDPEERGRMTSAQPLRWLSIGRTDLQTGVMALVRAVAQPTGF